MLVGRHWKWYQPCENILTRKYPDISSATFKKPLINLRNLKNIKMNVSCVRLCNQHPSLKQSTSPFEVVTNNCYKQNNCNIINTFEGRIVDNVSHVVKSWKNTKSEFWVRLWPRHPFHIILSNQAQLPFQQGNRRHHTLSPALSPGWVTLCAYIVLTTCHTANYRQMWRHPENQKYTQCIALSSEDGGHCTKNFAKFGWQFLRYVSVHIYRQTNRTCSLQHFAMQSKNQLDPLSCFHRFSQNLTKFRCSPGLHVEIFPHGQNNSNMALKE